MPSKNAAHKKVVEVEEDKKDDKVHGPPPKRELDLMVPADFAEALRERVPRPFVFGPIEMTGLDTEHWPADKWRDTVIANL